MWISMFKFSPLHFGIKFNCATNMIYWLWYAWQRINCCLFICTTVIATLHKHVSTFTSRNPFPRHTFWREPYRRRLVRRHCAHAPACVRVPLCLTYTYSAILSICVCVRACVFARWLSHTRQRELRVHVCVIIFNLAAGECWMSRTLPY